MTQDVVQVGDTVRRPVNSSSKFVAALLRLLEEKHFDGVPRYLGQVDGRDVLSCIAGDVPSRFQTWSNEQVAAAGVLLRSLHDATRGSALAGRCSVVCHHDAGPNNVVFRNGAPVAFIDFDTAAPGSPLEDFGYLLCKRNMCPSVLCLSDWLASQLPCARSFGGPNPSAGRVHRAPILTSSSVIRCADHLCSRRQDSICSMTHAGVAFGLRCGLDGRSCNPASPCKGCPVNDL